MPPSRVKDFIKDLVKDLGQDLGKVFAVRLRRPAKNGRTQRSSTATHHESDDSILADISGDFPFASPTLDSNSSLLLLPDSLTRELGPKFSTNASSVRSSLGESSARKASDMAQTFLPFVLAVAGPIPLVGTPMKAAIGGLLEIFKVMDRRGQNKLDLDDLTSRLDRLSRYLCNAPPAQDHLERSQRENIIGMLQETSATLTMLRKRCLAYPSVTQDIAGCFTKIDRYLAEYMLSSQMQSQDDIRTVLAILQRQQEFLMRIESLIIRGQSSVGPTVALGYVTLVDATGHSHPIPMSVCDSFEQFVGMLQLLFKRDSIEAQIQRRYIEKEQYDLCIDDGKQVTQLTSHEWPSIEEGTKIVMRVVIEQTTLSRGIDYRCHFCGAVNQLGTRSIIYSLQRQAGCSIDCRECKRRFQISRGRSSTKKSTQSSSIDSNPTTDAEMRLIRNFHVQQNDGIVRQSKYAVAAGGFGDVHKCTWNSGASADEVAVKSPRLSYLSDHVVVRINENIDREIHIWTRLKHQYVLPLHGTTEEFGPFRALVSPWMPNGTLNSYLNHAHKTLSMIDRLRLLKQIAEGLEYLHDKNVIHFDLTSYNILVAADGSPRLADFGNSNIIMQRKPAFSYSTCAVRWAAPEILYSPEDEPIQICATKSIDIYALGGIMLQVLYGKLPYWWLTNEQLVVAKLMHRKEPIDSSIEIQPNHLDFMRRCWSIKSEARPSVKEVMSYLQEALSNETSSV